MTTPAGTLARIAARKEAEAATLRCAAATLWAKAESLPPARDISVLRGGAVIAELKRRSPSGGALREGLDSAATAAAFAAAGAAALSVLTDAPDFGGSLDDLDRVRAAVDIPLLRKDFVVDPVQVAEARIGGADWVLLIAALLDDDQLAECLEATERSGAAAIVEAHDEDEVRRAVSAGAACIGINNRDLTTLVTDVATFARLRPLVPDTVLCVAESGMRDAAAVATVVSEGADAVLVGEALMRSESPEALCAEMVRVARSAARGAS